VSTGNHPREPEQALIESRFHLQTNRTPFFIRDDDLFAVERAATEPQHFNIEYSMMVGKHHPENEYLSGV